MFRLFFQSKLPFFLNHGSVTSEKSREELFVWLWDILLPLGLVGVHEGTVLVESRSAAPDTAGDTWLLDEAEAPQSRDWIEEEKEIRADLFFSQREDAEAAQRVLRETLPMQASVGEVLEEPEQDWSSQWKAFFLENQEGWEVEPFWKIQPAWLEEPLMENPSLGSWGPGSCVLKINPGAGFGTGTHETTQLCLERLGALFLKQGASWKGKTFLDYGTGSGILAIACAKLGATVIAVERDPLALENARSNALLNGVADQIEWRESQSVPSFLKGFDGVVANILRPVLVAHAHELVQSLKPGGTLILSGLLGSGEDLSLVLQAYSEVSGALQIPFEAPQLFEKKEWRAIQMRVEEASIFNIPLERNYEPKKFEKALYDEWEQAGCFEAKDENAPGQEAFSMVIPPPNVTGVLHIGHALTNTIQDTLVRWQRMQGKNVLWLPGTDHAGISTQVQVEKQLAQSGKGPTGKPLSRHDLGREKFIEKVWEWKNQYGSKITQQLRALGSSLDWKRERFTFDAPFSQAVRKVFVQLYQEGLIHRGERLIHWCFRCQTALSDLEVIPTPRQSFLWSIRYRGVDCPGELVVSTTRPETLLGDSAVAVHPDDPRYLAWHGKKVRVPLVNREIPVIVDAAVDLTFGTSVLKVTPAHDFQDYELGERHGLPLISLLDRDGKIRQEWGSYSGLKATDAREKIVEDLKAQGLLVQTEPHAQSVGTCDRCATVAEPILSKQWFVKASVLAEPAIEAVRQGKIQFSPPHWEKTYFEWMLHIRDWCISRQLWWGHSIPAWHCEACQGVTVSETDPSECQHCRAPLSQLIPDPDVLDTWFSASLWPFATLGWPNATSALKTFYPTAILETGFDILFFWVARMIMMGLHFMKEVPFHQVYLHALVRDEKGEKMSKTKGNVIDPLVVMDQYGTDALRFTLSILAGQGREIKLSLDRVEGYRAFCNKLWNAVQFFHFHQASHPVSPPPLHLNQKGAPAVEAWLLERESQLWEANQWILSRLQTVVQRVHQGLEEFELNVAAQVLYDFVWHELCDWFIELAKPSLADASSERRQEVLLVLYEVLDVVLKLAHPFMPFMTERLWGSLESSLFGKSEALEKAFLMQQKYPTRVFRHHEQAETAVQQVKALVEAVRNFRGEHQLSSKIVIPVALVLSPQSESFWKAWGDSIQTLARISIREPLSSSALESCSVLSFLDPVLAFQIPTQNLVDSEEEYRRLEKEKKQVFQELEWVQKKLAQESFLQKAPQALVQQEKAREEQLLKKGAQLDETLTRLRRKCPPPSNP